MDGAFFFFYFHLLWGGKYCVFLCVKSIPLVLHIRRRSQKMTSRPHSFNYRILANCSCFLLHNMKSVRVFNLPMINVCVRFFLSTASAALDWGRQVGSGEAMPPLCRWGHNWAAENKKIKVGSPSEAGRLSQKLLPPPVTTKDRVVHFVPIRHRFLHEPHTQQQSTTLFVPSGLCLSSCVRRSSSSFSCDNIRTYTLIKRSAAWLRVGR